MTIYENIAAAAGIPLEDVNEFIDMEARERSDPWGIASLLEEVLRIK